MTVRAPLLPIEELMATHTEPVAPVPTVERRGRGKVVVSWLEWATSCPPPRHNFVTLPKIRSESPAFGLRHPDVASLDEVESAGQRDVLDAEGHKGERP